MWRENALVIMLVVTCLGEGTENRITSFLPDSLTTWQVNTNLSGSMSSNNDGTDESNVGWTEVVSRESQSNQSSKMTLTPGINYSLKYIRPKREITTSINITGAYTYDHSQNEDIWLHEENVAPSITEKEKNNRERFTPTLNSSFTYYEYLPHKLGLGFTGSYYFQKTVDNQQRYYEYWDSPNYSNQKTTTESIDKTHHSLMNLVFFRGRIYNGSYAAKAEEILAELLSKDLMERDLTESEFLQLSQIILEKGARYHYDSRIKNIEAMMGIADYLESIHVIKNDKILPIVILQDIYLNTPYSVERNFGTKFYISALYMNNLSYSNDEEVENYKRYSYHYDSQNNPINDSLTYSSRIVRKTTNRTSENIPAIRIGIDYYQVKNWRFWYQTNLMAQYEFYPKIFRSKNITSTTNYTNSYGDTIDYDNNRLSLTLSARANYQWNSRSYSYISTSLSYVNLTSDENTDGDNDYNKLTDIFSLEISPGLKYYLTPKISYNISCRWYVYKEYYRLKSRSSIDDMLDWTYRKSEFNTRSAISFGLSIYL